MKTFEIKEIDNAYIIKVIGAKKNGEKAFKHTEELKLLEFLGEQIMEQRIEAKVK